MEVTTHLATLQTSVANMLRLHANRPACWYNVQPFVSCGDSNLASYLGMNKDDYIEVLLALKLVKKRGRDIIMCEDQWWHTFAICLNDDHQPPCKFELTRQCHKECRRMLWIKLGGEDDSVKYCPRKQPANIKHCTFAQLQRKYGIFEDGVSEVAKVLFAKNKIAEMHDQENQAREEGANVGDSNNESGYDDDEPTIGIDSSKYPFLSKAKLTSFKPSELYGLLRDIRRVSNEKKNMFKFEYQIDCKMKRDLIIIPQVSSDRSFKTNAKPILKGLARSFVSDSYCEAQAKETGNVIDYIRKEEETVMIERIIEHFCTSHKDIFVKVANDNGLNFENKKMSKHYAAAMFAESGIGPGKSRIINRYLTAFFGRRVMVSETDIFRDGELALDELPPVTKSKQLSDKKKVNYYVKPLCEILTLGMEKKFNTVKRECADKIESIDISWSADHGGGFFRAIMKCIINFRGSDILPLQFSHRIGQMQCKSDKYDLIVNTMGPDLNRGIQAMLKNDYKTAKAIRVYLKTTESKFFVTPEDHEENFAIDNRYIHIATVPSSKVKIAITGDLAFYSTMLGKPGMDSKWCPWCDAAAKEWSKVEQVKGESWTRQTYMQKLLDIQQNPTMSQYNRKGVKFSPILDVDPTLYVPPPLHIKLGLVNRAFIKPDGYSYFSWSQIRIENIPDSERVAFNLLRQSIDELNDTRIEDKLLFNLQHLSDNQLALKESLQHVNL